MKPAQSVPFTVASIFVVAVPGFPASALISTAAMMISATIQKAAPDLGTRNVRWLAAPMKKSIGIEKSVFVRDASPARAPAGVAAGLAGLPAPVSRAFWIKIFCLGQITNQTFAHMMEQSSPPSRMAHP